MEILNVMSWIPVLGNLWDVPVEGSHSSMSVRHVTGEYFQGKR
jgi:hypothetical protein